MKSLTGIFFTVSVCAYAYADAMVSNVAVSQDAATARVTVTYDLDEDAIVTLDVATNGVSVGAGCLKRLVGDVNRKVSSGEGKTICWFPAKSFPGNLIADGSLSAKITTWSQHSPPDYLVCDLTVTNGISYYPCEDALPYDITNRIYKTTHFVMRRIHATGRVWRMGSPIQGEVGDVYDDSDKSKTSTITHNVVLTNDYYIGVYPVTQKQYWNMTGGYLGGGWEGSYFRENDDAYWSPVENLSYDTLRGTDCVWPQDGYAVSGALLKLRALTGLKLDLPTEAQWEYACRAGTGSGYNSGEECTTQKTSGTACPNLDELGWYGGNNQRYGNSNGTTYEVGLKKPNAWGLYDMHGNVFEMCLDWYSESDDYTDTFAAGWESGAPTVAPEGALSGMYRVARGGGYFYGPLHARSCYRRSFDPATASKHYGFRLAYVIGNE